MNNWKANFKMLYYLKSVQKRINYFHCCINLTKHVQGLYAENLYKTLIKEIKVNLINGETYHAHRNSPQTDLYV